jgi:dihydrofolate synthase / folylpolyglutamate synthase
LLQEAVYRVGSYVSPHLVRYNERFCCNQVPISDIELQHLYQKATTLEGHEFLTEFELLTVMGFLYFSSQNLDYLVLETGLGGQHDATNVVIPKVSVITRIGIDHTEFLGPTLTHIAKEKAGIIKEGVPLVTLKQVTEVDCVLEEKAIAKNAPLSIIHPLNELPSGLKLTGSYQKENIPVALKAVQLLVGTLPEKVIEQGLKKAQILGRFNRIQTQEGTLILDGAHNGIGIETLVQSIQELFPTQKPTLIFGILKSKSLEEMLPHLDHPKFKLYYCDFEPGRSHDFETVASYFTQPILKYELKTPLPNDPLIVLSGSLYFLGELIKNPPHPALRKWYNEGGF